MDIPLGQHRAQRRMAANWSAAGYAMASLSVHMARPRHWSGSRVTLP